MKRDRKPQAPKKVVYLNGLMECIRCRQQWDVRDLNPELVTVKCPVCSIPNSIKEARFRAQQVKG